MESKDAIVLKGIQRGDQTAFEELFHTYHAKLFSFARKLLRDDELAREAVLDVFLKFWNQREKITITKSVEAYLFVSTRNQCFNYLRSRKGNLQLCSLLIYNYAG